MVEVICCGTPYDLGIAQGMALRDKIRAAREELLSRLEAFRLLQPRWLPYWAYRLLAEKKARRLLLKGLQRDPAMSLRLAGLADGAGVGLSGIYLLNALEPFLSSVGDCTTCPGACSAVAVRGKRSRTGEPMIARNFDYLPIVQPFYMLRDCRPDKGARALEFSTAPLAGAVDGMNESGLCITYNYAFTIDQPIAPTGPISMLISEALECCSTVADAAAWIASRPRWGGGLLMMADASGDIASLELSSTRSHLRRPETGEDYLFHSNAVFSEPMREIQAPWDSVYNQRAPVALRGHRLHASAELRDGRFRELLRRETVLDQDGLAEIMADHGPDGLAGECTPCVHSDYWQTTACLQYFPRSRRIRFAYDTACQAKYQEVSL